VYITIDENKHKNEGYSKKKCMLFADGSVNEKGLDRVGYLGIGSYSWAHLTFFLGKKNFQMLIQSRGRKTGA
jgi:hypothetical protein